ncbi:MAG: IS66 family transposase, partial [Deltaproteobacteria bacterium]|nr:IS66 family transposase [Deltaproteobacteria bacterium]
MKGAKRIDLNLDQVDALLKRVENGSLKEGDYEIIKAMAETIHLLSQVVDEKATSIRRLLRMLFGPGTEKLEKVIKNRDKNKSGSAGSNASDQNPSDKKNKPDKKPKGHGRNGAADYTGAGQIKVPHATLKPGDKCIACLKGKVYEMSVPAVIVRI